ncbi:MAG: hydroxyacid dehydrogenase [Flavobacteriales bacterium]|nr:hydroxyacid dehydrogenase [Flavobacteriales bacterium]MCB9449179.1 hydroxyacid dehydrogenase [Flavobacteriales bacterium]
MKFLFADSVHPAMEKGLTALGIQCDLRYDISPEEAHAVIGAYDGLVIRSKFRIDAKFLDQAVRLKCIARYGSGMENIDVPYAESKGIRCLSAPEGNRDAVANHALGMLLSLMKNISRSHNEVRNGTWEREGNRGYELDGKTVAIIGYGNTGSAFAKRLAGFDVKVLVYDPYVQGIEKGHVHPATMERIFKDADVLSLHVPLTDETRNLVNAAYLARFEKNIFLINTSRGQVLNTADLVAAMESGKVRAAGLDVLEYEKSSFESLAPEDMPAPLKYLLESPDSIVTPHIAGWSFESYEKLAMVLVEKVGKMV